MGNDRAAVWFPLALFGFALLALAVYAFGYASWFSASSATGGYDLVVPGQQLGTGGVGGTGLATAQVTMVGIAVSSSGGPGIPGGSGAWLVVNTVVFLGTLVFYAVRARRRGTPIRRRWLAALGLGGPVAIALLDFTAYWDLRLDSETRGALVAACGLLVLAWLERSRILLVVAALFVLADVVLLDGMVGALVAAAVVFAGAFTVLLRTPRRQLGGTVENGPGEH